MTCRYRFPALKAVMRTPTKQGGHHDPSDQAKSTQTPEQPSVPGFGCVVGTQAETVADDDTQDWLANVMSNTVTVRRPSLGGAGALGASPAATPLPKSPRQKAADRVARKTLIIKSGAADAVEPEASAVSPLPGVR